MVGAVTPVRLLAGLVFRVLLGGCAERSTEEGAAPGTGAAPVVVAATAAAAAEVSAEGQTVVVAGVVDGDTIELRNGGGSASSRSTRRRAARASADPARVTVLICGADRTKFPGPPEDLYAGRTICVTGTIETYQGVPEIEASSPGQIAIAG